ncbi:MAG TPA: GMC family oxidoreductase [Lacunisphaera sp.]|jgi:choline dehydrogenase-like flavoprotein
MVATAVSAAVRFNRITLNTHYDVIIIGTGAGGGTLAHQLAVAGKKILVLERGAFLPTEKANWDTKSVFLENRYHTREVWSDKEGKPLHPGTGYWVGGNTKVYGAALFRLRAEDFERLEHRGGISPEWPVKYDEFEPYYCRAERLFSVHGRGGIDPTEPRRSQEFPFPAVSSEPRMQEIEDEVRTLGFKPFPTPLGLKLNEANMVESACIRCDTCDGYPCLVDGKADADVDCVRPVMHRPNVTLLTQAKVTKLITNASGRAIESVEVELDGAQPAQRFTADIVAVCCGAINSAALLLKSACDRHPRGLANSSDLVGRNFMFHQSGAILAITRSPNPSRYMKTFSLNDFYFGEKDYDFPMGNIQPIGSFQYEMMEGDAPPMTPDFVLKRMKTHAVPWWLTTEDLASPDNRVRIVDGAIRLEYTPNNTESFKRLMSRWTEVLKKIDALEHVVDLHAYFKKRILLEGVGHQNGTCRFGSDPAQSVLNLDCRTHDVDNLYVVDGSFFPSCGAVNPSLTIVANAIRVADHLIERMK